MTGGKYGKEGGGGGVIGGKYGKEGEGVDKR